MIKESHTEFQKGALWNPERVDALGNPERMGVLGNAGRGGWTGERI